MTSLELRLLGPPQVQAGGAAVGFDTRKAVAILARLAVEGPQRRETLSALLWPESDGARARGALRRTLSVMRSKLDDPSLVIDRDEIRLAPHTYRCDVDRFHELVRDARSHHTGAADVCEGCIERLTEAVGLHRDDFLAGFSLRDSPDFDDWQYFQAESLRADLEGALDLLVIALVHHGQLTLAVEHVRRRLALDPLHEPTHRRLMLLHAWSGRREEAIRQYRDCIGILDSELGVTPLNETTQLYRSILAGQPPAAPTRGSSEDPATPPTGQAKPLRSRDGPSRLPLVGRQAELDQLLDLHGSSGPDGRLAVVEGEAGIGKSRLLEEFTGQVGSVGAAAVVVRCYPGEEALAYGPIADALRTAVLGERAGVIARAWLSEVARLVPELLDRDDGLPTPSPLGSQEADRRFFEGVRQALVGLGSPATPAVLAIEDMQWADAATQDVVTFLAHRLQGTPLCLVLTWRTEQIGRDHPLRRLLADTRSTTGGTQIVLDRLGEAEVAELVRDAGVAGGSSGRLFHETQGLPLLVVEYLRALRSGRLDHDASWTLPAGVRDLHAQRLAGLSETARQVLTTAAVLGHSFGLETLLHASGRTEEETVEALDELLAGDVLTEVGAGNGYGDTTYDFRHHTLRAVVYDQASIARRRLLHARAARSLQRHGRATDGQAPLAVIAEHHRLAGEEQEAARMFVLAADHARTLAAHADTVKHYRAALALDHPDTASLHESIGDVLTLLGDYREALNSYQASAANDISQDRLARLERKIAGVHARRGDWAAAEAHLEAAIGALPEVGEPTLRAHLEAELSLSAHRRGATDEARERAEASLQLAQGCGAVLAAAEAHNILGIICRAEGDPDSAVAHLERSLAIAEQTDDPEPRIAALNNLALAYADRGELPPALELAKTALAGCRSQGDRHREAAILNNVADLLRTGGQEDEAMHHLKQAVAIFAEVGEPERHEPEIWKLVDW